MNNIILAAGAVVWRENVNGKIEVAIIHRPKYDDLSFPKGKADPAEPLIACAFREVIEETNFTTEFGPFLGEVEYLTIDGIKRVSYWSAKVVGDNNFKVNEEVDELKWIEVSEVPKFLSLETDRQIFKKFLKLKLNSKPLILIRHAKAVSRDEWLGDDDDRPLDAVGQLQAKRLLAIYQVFNPKHIHTSDAVRCYDTVDPIATGLDLKLEVTSKLSESGYKKDKEKAIDYAKELLKSNIEVMICSHNPILPKLLNKITRKSEIESDAEKLLPAEAWVIHRIGKEIVQVDRLPAPKV